MLDTARLLADLLCVGLCVSAAVCDLRSRRIPDWLTLPALAMGLALSVTAGVSSLVGALLAAGLCGGALALFALGGGLGWGDVKLMAAVGALLGWPLPSWSLVLYALIYTALIGGGVAVIVAFYEKKLAAALKATVAWPRRRRVQARSGVTIPYGVAIALGTIWAVATRYFPQLLVG